MISWAVSRHCASRASSSTTAVRAAPERRPGPESRLSAWVSQRSRSASSMPTAQPPDPRAGDRPRGRSDVARRWVHRACSHGTIQKRMSLSVILPYVQRGLFEVLLLSVGAGVLGTWIVLRGLAFYSHAV